MSEKNDLSKKIEEDINDLEKKIYDLKNLIGLGISLSSNLNFDSLIESILYSCIGQLILEKVAILLPIDIDNDNIHVRMSKGYDNEEELNLIVLDNESPIVEYFINQPYPQDFSELSEIIEFRRDIKKLALLSPSLIVPMKSKNSLKGIIILGNKITGEKFSVNEREFIRDLAKFAAIAVDNSQLYLMATHDRMTKLYIHHYFQQALSNEVKHSKENKLSLSLIMADIDFFKKVNDDYGHPQGDIILIEIAKIFNEEIRDVDIAARYGGEEFTVILPGANLEEAIFVAERLRKKVEAHKFTLSDGIMNVTISIGVAELNRKKEEEADLISRADIALYEAKDQGRNRVIASKGNNN